MKLKGSETEKNLLTAFAGESQARNSCVQGWSRVAVRQLAGSEQQDRHCG